MGTLTRHALSYPLVARWPNKRDLDVIVYLNEKKSLSPGNGICWQVIIPNTLSSTPWTVLWREIHSGRSIRAWRGGSLPVGLISDFKYQLTKNNFAIAHCYKLHQLTQMFPIRREGCSSAHYYKLFVEKNSSSKRWIPHQSVREGFSLIDLSTIYQPVFLERVSTCRIVSCCKTQWRLKKCVWVWHIYPHFRTSTAGLPATLIRCSNNPCYVQITNPVCPISWFLSPFQVLLPLVVWRCFNQPSAYR
jgi:hypothetical protein